MYILHFGLQEFTRDHIHDFYQFKSSVFQSDNSHFFANVTFYQQVCENKINFKGTDI